MSKADHYLNLESDGLAISIENGDKKCSLKMFTEKKAEVTTNSSDTITSSADKQILTNVKKSKTSIKEDEIMSNPACLTLNQRIDIVQPILDRSKTVYCYCINSDPHTLMDKARTVSSRGGMGVHINFWSGMGAYKAIRDEDNGTFIHFQNKT